MTRNPLRFSLDRRLSATILSLTVLALVATACAKPPTGARDQAERALADARAAGAAEYAIAGLAAAEEAFEKGSSAMTQRHYKEAAEWFAIAVEKAEAARGEVLAGREAAERDARDTFALVRQNLDRATELLEQLEGCTSPGSDPEETPDILAARLDEVRDDVAAGEEELAAGEFRAALGRAADADRQAGELVAGLEKAIEEGTCP